ncbi:histidine--tRNA ligase [Chelativorans xinjiangense]|uniref:histidine--tRNA ligase n=1 Tax=Chelativorans xinjiangense TaxID=2681485 RepID=UPI00135AE81F|nr:histidine--tRNA ligase [Chelativorans xinjiangense]
MAGKADKVKARLPRGLVDRHPADIRAVDEMVTKIRAVYELYGFEPVETPLIEYTDALGKFLPDQDRPNEGVFSFQDEDEQWLSLRYDLTAPLARFVAENFERLPKPYRSYRAGWVFRNEKPGPGRFRQFMQVDADTVGTPGVAADAEMAMMMADVMEALGIARGDYVIRVNNRKVLDGVLEAIGLGGEENAGRRLTVLRAIDKLDKFRVEGVKLLLGPGRWDGGKEGEGDFTKGANLNPEQIDVIASYLASTGMYGFARLEDDPHLVNGDELEATHSFGNPSGEKYYFSNLNTIVGLGAVVGETATGSEAVRELEDIFKITSAAGYGSNRIRIDPSVVRGLEYYTGPVFEAELTFPVVNEKGETVQFGSVGGGGRYDGLVSRFRGEPVPATGFSIGVSRLMTALKNLGKLEVRSAVGPILVTVMDRDRVADYMRLTKILRDGLNPVDENGRLLGPPIPVEMYQGNPKNFGNQLKYADRRGSPCVVIQGGDEREKGEVQIKDLVEGKRLSEEIEDNVTWREARPAQFSVPEGELVEAVKRVLQAQAEERGAEK